MTEPLGIESDNGEIICRFSSESNNNRANAKLIAAAPKMLEYIESVLALYESDPDDLKTMDKGIKMFKEVIKKVKGE